MTPDCDYRAAAVVVQPVPTCLALLRALASALAEVR